MSNSIAPGSSADVNVKITALTTNSNVPVTYKTIILKKNLVNGVNTLTQEMMSATNTKYVIKYDYVLGEDVTIPANCVFEFDGGSISGAYTITGANTGIIASLVKIFNTNVTLAGSWNIVEVYPEWFGAASTLIDNTIPFQKALDYCDILSAPIKVQKCTYNFKNTLIIKHSNTRIIGSGYRDSILFNDSLTIPFIITIGKANNSNEEVTYIDIKDIKLVFNGSGQRSDYPFYFNNTTNLTFNYVSFAAYNSSESSYTYKAVVNGRNGGFSQQVCTMINNCIFHFCGLQLDATDSIISKNLFWSVTSEYAIEIRNAGNSIISNNEIVGGAVYGGIYCAPSLYEINNIKIIGNYFDGNTEGMYDTKHAILVENRMWKTTITGNNFSNYKSGAIKIKEAKGVIISSNVFDNNDYFGNKEPDIDLYSIATSCVIIANVFNRDTVLVNNGETWEQIERTPANKSQYGAPIINIAGSTNYKPCIVTNNFRNDYNSYLPATYTGLVYAFNNFDNFIANSTIFGDPLSSGDNTQRPSGDNLKPGYVFIENGTPIFWTGTSWVNATGATV